MVKKTSFSFEEKLNELEVLVKKMESKDLSLDDSLKTFEQGIALTRKCYDALNKAEQTVTQLIEKNGDLLTHSFDKEVESDSSL